MKEEALKLADAMEGRAKIRRQAKDRLSVQEGANDRLADQLEQASDMIRKLVAELDKHQDKSLDELMKWQQELELKDAWKELDKQGEQFAEGELVLWGKFDEDNQMVDYFSEDARKSNYLFAEDAKSDVWIPLYAYTAPQTKPLSGDEIHEAVKPFLQSYYLEGDERLYGETSKVLVAVEDWYGFARAIEERIFGK